MLAVVAVCCFILAVAVRLIHYQQSLWCDEMAALLDYISAPWSKIIAPAGGEYVPNDHPLFSILAKLCFIAGGGSHRAAGSATVAGLIRFPSLLAGALTPIMLAWPMRCRAPISAVLIAVFTALNPWLVAFADEARGYSLMMLLGVVATNLLPDGRQRWPAGYAITVAAMIYTVPVAGMLVVAHAIYVFGFQRSAIAEWLRGVSLAAVLLIFLFLPMYRGILFYLHHPLVTPDSYSGFLDQLPRFASAGQYVPFQPDPTRYLADPPLNFVCWLLPVCIVIAGSIVSRHRRELQIPIALMAIAVLLFLVAGIFVPAVAQVRFVPWCGLWLILAGVSVAHRIHDRWGMRAMLPAVIIAAGWCVYRDVVLLPSQPVREAMLQADQDTPPHAQIVMALLTASESTRVYGAQTVRHHALIVAGDPNAFVRAEHAAIASTGSRPWVILSYEEMPRDFSPRFWDYFQARYELQSRLAGRISSVAVYKPRP